MPGEGSRYKRLRTIASGGMGTVFLGRMEGAGGFERLVAIKVMHAHLAENPDFVSMFLDEARLAASIRHPNVVSMLDVENAAEGLSLVMEYVDGPSLHQLVKQLDERDEKLPVDVTLRLMIDALAGLHAAHELTGPDGQPANLVHRDVSPQNILLGTDGTARITDFGVARAEDRLSLTQNGEVKGKFAYMSLDQIRGGKIDRRSDVYSAGIILWELLAGQRLFTGDSPTAVMLSAAAGPVQSPSDVDDQVPHAIDEVCMRALCKAREDRWPTAAAFAEALEDAAASIGMRIGRSRDLATIIAQMDEDGPTKLKPQAAMEWAARISRAKGAAAPEAPKAPGKAAPPAAKAASPIAKPAATAKAHGEIEEPWSDANTVALPLADIAPMAPAAPRPAAGAPAASAPRAAIAAPAQAAAAPTPVEERTRRPGMTLLLDDKGAASLDDDGPTRVKPQGAEEYIEQIARARAAQQAAAQRPSAPPEPAADRPSGFLPLVDTARMQHAPPNVAAAHRALLAHPAQGDTTAAPLSPPRSPVQSTPTGAGSVASMTPPAASRGYFSSMLLGAAIGLVALAAVLWLMYRGPFQRAAAPAQAAPAHVMKAVDAGPDAAPGAAAAGTK